MVPELVQIQTNNEVHRPIMHAIDMGTKYVYSPRQNYPEDKVVPLKAIVPLIWSAIVVNVEANETERVNCLKLYYTHCRHFKKNVSTKAIWIKRGKSLIAPDGLTWLTWAMVAGILLKRDKLASLPGHFLHLLTRLERGSILIRRPFDQKSYLYQLDQAKKTIKARETRGYF